MIRLACADLLEVHEQISSSTTHARTTIPIEMQFAFVDGRPIDALARRERELGSTNRSGEAALRCTARLFRRQLLAARRVVKLAVAALDRADAPEYDPPFPLHRRLQENLTKDHQGEPQGEPQMLPSPAPATAPMCQLDDS
eukprot:701023-Pleurochrysis_carterae.AAC.2